MPRKLLKTITVIFCSALILFALTGCGENDEGSEKRIHPYDMGTSFVTSVKDSKMHIQTEITLELNNEKDIEILDERKYVVTNAINEVLSGVTEEQLKASDELMPQLGAKVAERINGDLGITSVIKVYFSKFVSQ